jgi:hypothetical protein
VGEKNLWCSGPLVLPDKAVLEEDAYSAFAARMRGRARIYLRGPENQRIREIGMNGLRAVHDQFRRS